jgi:hypothetical protein
MEMMNSHERNICPILVKILQLLVPHFQFYFCVDFKKFDDIINVPIKFHSLLLMSKCILIYKEFLQD